MARKQTIHNTTLDFANIKRSLRDYLGSQSEFSDYDFEGSGLSALIDVLAYNTHQNALIANFALNESFLTTAQTRSAMVNHALNYGYIPRSKSGATAIVNVSLNLSGVSPRPATVTIPQYTRFTSTVDGVSYTFYTLDEYIGYDRTGTGVYTFENEAGDKALAITEGVLKTKTFRCNDALERQIYVIPDKDLNLLSLSVKVYDNASTDNFDIYESTSTVGIIDAETKLFIPLESYNGFYEINFGDGVNTGLAPVPGNIIRAQYLSSNGSAANGAETFTGIDQVEVNGTSYPLIISTVTKGALGDEKEGVESIRLSAPLNYLAGGRLVTSSDYIAIIGRGVPGIKSVNAWGGEEEDEPKYGKVMISIIFKDDVDAAQKQAIERTIKDNIVDTISMISIDGEFVSPEFTYLDLSTEVRYNAARTARTPQAMQNLIRSEINKFFDDNLGAFNQVFRKSRVTNAIDDADNSILSSKVEVKMASRFQPIVNPLTIQIAEADYDISFLNKIDFANDQTPVITSDRFYFDGLNICEIQNKLGSTTLQIVDIDGRILNDNVGSFNPETGEVNLRAFKPAGIVSGNSYIAIKAVPQDDSVIKPLRNHVIDLGLNNVVAIGDADLANNSGVVN